MTSTEGDGARDDGPRPRGRPRLVIDEDAMADAVAELFAEGGFDGVTIADTAEKLSVSRATLYRTVATKEQLVGVLFERSTRELTDAAQQIIDTVEDPRERLFALVRLQVDAAIRMRQYMPVFFGGAGLPAEVFARWHSWSRRFEAMWAGAVSAAMDASVLQRDDPVVTTRLLLGMCIWVSRWYRSSEGMDTAAIAEAAVRLLQQPQPPVHYLRRPFGTV